MQLVYVWIKKNEKEFIENNEFNFYGEHYFNLTQDKDKMLRLTYEKRDTIGSEVFRNTGVLNITAIVGENGCGKTTLIEELKKLGNTEYDGEFLQVFTDNNFFYYSTNIHQNKIIFDLDIKEISLSETQISRILTSNSSYINNFDLWDYTLSQISKYGEIFYELLFKLDYNPREPMSIIDRRKGLYEHENKKYKLLNNLYRWSEVNIPGRFQSMCDLLFFYDVFQKGKSFLGKRILEISFEIHKYDNNQFGFLPMIEEFKERYVSKYSGIGRLLHSNLIIELFEERFCMTYHVSYCFYAFQEKKIAIKILESKNIDSDILEIFLFYLSTDSEFIAECDKQIQRIRQEAIIRINNYHVDNNLDIENIDDNDLYDAIDLILDNKIASSEDEEVFTKFIMFKLIDDLDDYSLLPEELEKTNKKILDLRETIEICFDKFLLVYKRFENDEDDIWNLLIEINKKNTTEEMREYFQHAFIEIEEFSKITKNSNYFKISQNTEEKLIEFIGKKVLCIEEQPSFVLRHLKKINGLEMSSGERAMTNLFSWINTMPQLAKINPGEKEQLQKSIILLIDEVDLYVHPEWQRQLVHVLCKSVASIFEYYDVQIILTTHSPFVLSDIPSENIIYLKLKDDRFHIEPTNMKTFGSNIYLLLKNSFFMNSTMGEFSRSIICSINETLNSEEMLSETKYKAYEKIIKEIGEPIVQKHLSEKLKRKLPINQRIADLENQIVKLRGQFNDKN